MKVHLVPISRSRLYSIRSYETQQPAHAADLFSLDHENLHSRNMDLERIKLAKRYGKILRSIIAERED